MLTIMKGFSGFGALIIFVVGLALVGITIYGYLNSQIFLNTSARDGIMGVMAVSSFLVVLGSALGIYGIKKGNSILICVFQIFVIIFLIIFFSLGIAAEVMPGQFFEGNCTSSSNTAIIQANKAFTISKNLCTVVCPCAMTPQSIAKYDPTDRAILNSAAYRMDPNGALFIQKCTVANVSGLDFALADALGQVQTFLECSLWCPGDGLNLFYRFSNVNNGKPQSFCYTQLKNQVDKYGGTVGIASFVAAAFLLLVCACNLCICCHPKRKGLSIKDRFVYMNNGQYTNL